MLDTKYANPERKTQFGTCSLRNSDLYQIAFYADQFDCPGLLVHPKAERDVDVTFKTRGAPEALTWVNRVTGCVTGVRGRRPVNGRMPIPAVNTGISS